MSEIDTTIIGEKAKNIREEYNPNDKIPFPFSSLEKDGFEVLYNTDFFKEVDAKEGLAGVLFYNTPKNNFRAILNETLPMETTYFSTATLLGHFFLHGELVKANKVFFYGLNSPIVSGNLSVDDNLKYSQEAKSFAYNLLLPETLVRRAWDKLGDLDEMAKLFNVSFYAMSNRLKFLKLIAP